LRVLVTGASGFIGSALAEALLRAGHEVLCASRHPRVIQVAGRTAATLEVDLSRVPAVEWWVPHLANVNAVINAVGILREHGGQTFSALHAEAPSQLFKACALVRIPTVIQVSALGADAGATSRYHLSKRAADELLRQLPLRAAIVQPSLVYGPEGASAGLFNMLASLPVVAMPGGGAMQVQPVHIEDVIAGIVSLLDAPPAGQQTIAFVGPQPLSMRDYLGALRSCLEIRSPLRMLAMPESLFRSMARMAAWLPGSALDSETAAMLLRGNAAPAEPFTQLLGRPPREVSQFIAPRDAKPLRIDAVLRAWTLALRGAIAFVWLWTGVVSMGLYPVRSSLDLLERVGLEDLPALVALYGAAWIDLLLGFLTLTAPVRWRPAVWAAQLTIIAAYTLLITVFLPEYWLHPYGPISKNIPFMAAIGLLWALEPPQSRGHA
jgi:uncharacterized protein YbjT (DUF2867 family)